MTWRDATVFTLGFAAGFATLLFVSLWADALKNR